jgi:FdrA protein
MPPLSVIGLSSAVGPGRPHRGYALSEPPSDNPQIAALLRSEVRVVNIGLAGFAEEMRQAGVPVVQLDWAPPALADPRLRGLLAKLSSK